MTTKTSDIVLEFDHFRMYRHGPENNWLIEWKTTGLVEYLDTPGKTNQEFVARHLADRLERLDPYLKENRI